MDRDEILKQCHVLGLDGATVLKAARPAVRISANLASAPQELGTSRFGGCPDLPASIAWPTWDAANWFRSEIAYARRNLEGRFIGEDGPRYWRDFIERAEDDLARPTRHLTFVAQLNLADLDGFTLSLSLPHEGLLSFFYDLRNWPPSYDPAAQDAWQVVFSSLGTQLVRHDPPAPVQGHPSRNDDWSEPYEAQMAFKQVWTLPEQIESSNTESAAWTSESYESLLEATRGQSPNHQVTGAPTQAQGDMASERQLVSSGIYCGRPPSLSAAERTFHEREARQWKLLFQVDSDDALDLLLGDAGLLYWWIREPDALKRRFDLVRGAFQCS